MLNHCVLFRFKTNTRLCLSISDFHPDTWNPAWSVGTILTGLLSFMLEKSPTLGSIETTDQEKKSLAIKSIEFNLKDKIVTELFPETVEVCHKFIILYFNRDIWSKLFTLPFFVQEMKTIQETRIKSSTQTNSLSGVRKASVSLGINQGSSNNYQNVIATAVVAIGFALFAYSVRYVLKSLSYDETPWLTRIN